MTYLIYLDVCCYNRPFDDLTQMRILLEAEATIKILGACRRQQWQLLSSEVIDLEINKIRNLDKKNQILNWVNLATVYSNITDVVQQRADYLIQLGFKSFDALHVACAEAGCANILLTTDDRLIRLASRCDQILRIKVSNPLAWLTEVTNA